MPEDDRQQHIWTTPDKRHAANFTGNPLNWFNQAFYFESNSVLIYILFTYTINMKESFLEDMTKIRKGLLMHCPVPNFHIGENSFIIIDIQNEMG